MKRNCKTLDVDRNFFTSTDLIGSVKKRNCFMARDYVDTFLDELKELAEDLEFDRTMVKTLACTFCPYETINILSIEHVNLEKIDSILRSINFYDE